jgi:hypothetical protein
MKIRPVEAELFHGEGQTDEVKSPFFPILLNAPENSARSQNNRENRVLDSAYLSERNNSSPK